MFNGGTYDCDRKGFIPLGMERFLLGLGFVDSLAIEGEDDEWVRFT